MHSISRIGMYDMKPSVCFLWHCVPGFADMSTSSGWQVEATWEDMCQQMLTIRQVFLYMDRSYVVATPGVRSLFDMGLQLFRTHLAQHREVSGRKVNGKRHPLPLP